MQKGESAIAFFVMTGVGFWAFVMCRIFASVAFVFGLAIQDTRTLLHNSRKLGQKRSERLLAPLWFIERLVDQTRARGCGRYEEIVRL